MKNSKIEWTDHTFSPWHGCMRVSPGCANCYAESLSRRWGRKIWGPPRTTERMTFTEKHWQQPFAWDREAARDGVRRKVFCASMSDVFEDHPGVVQERMQLWALINSTPNLDWLLLTKRPQNILTMIPRHWREQAQANVWFGASVESAEYVDRLEWLRRVPAVVRFISYEPALGPVTWSDHLEGIDWLIIGGESGPGARDFSLDWARTAIAESRQSGVAPFVKQLGARPVDSFGFSLRLQDRKGDDMSEFPPELRVREFPTPRAAEQLVLA